MSDRPTEAPVTRRISRTDEEWRARLTPEQFRVARQRGTERAFTGEYWDCHDAGTYRCVCCDEPLFAAAHKFDSGTGWPSFTQPVRQGCIEETTDTSFGMRRVELQCTGCGAHLGHVFFDGPPPTRERYCINSASLKLDQQG